MTILNKSLIKYLNKIPNYSFTRFWILNKNNKNRKSRQKAIKKCLDATR